jgi:F-type H+-transporting ATPase subunit alpha
MSSIHNPESLLALDEPIMSLDENAAENLEAYEVDILAETESIGEILSVQDGVAFVSGLEDVRVGELVEFVDKQLFGMALNLDREKVGIIIFGDDSVINQGDSVKALGKLVDVQCGDHLLGHVTDGIGEIIDVEENIAPSAESERKNVERKAPGVITRLSVTQPLLTGYKVIDSMLPIGRGQRELIIGDRQTGKSTIAIDTIINQRYINEDAIDCYAVYVGIGQKQSTIFSLKELLKKNNALHYTTIVAATASQSASLQFISAYTGCAIAEYYRDSGRHALIIYDDLSKHAAAYRQLSLLLRRPPGREAFPGDVFYAHARLLERACKLNKDFGNGSLTALPIVETQAGDLSGYIPTNVISITDGQIFLERELFFKGQRPAVNVGNSVSRVGSKAQPYALKLVTGSLRYELAQYREYQVFAQFDSDLDETTKNVLTRGRLLTESLIQKPHAPLELYKQVLIILAASFGFILRHITDIKKDLYFIGHYEDTLFNILEQEEVKEVYAPVFNLLENGSKADFAAINELPLVWLLNLVDIEIGS